MAKVNTSKTTPKLRFPKFLGAAEWSIKPMEKLYSFMRNNSLSRDKLNYERGVTKNIHYGDIHTKYPALFDITKERVPFINDSEDVPDANSDDYCVEGDLIFADASEDTDDVGKCMEIVRLDNERLLAGQHTILVRQKGDAIALGFGGHLFKSGYVRAQIKRESQGTKVYSISPSRLGNIQVAYPREKAEQQKITDCLTSLDEVIAAQGRKVMALKAHKRGLMQQLFPREGETRPRLRFPEFHDAPEWEETTIGKIGKFYYGKSAPKWSLEADAPTRCVRYGELYTKFGAVITETFSRTNIDPKNLRFSKGGEILVPRVGEKPEDFGRCCCYLPLANIAIGEMISVFETAQIPLFYTYYFRNLYRQFARVVEGQNVKNLYYVELEPLAICRPSREEQQRIAECLSALDTQVATEANLLATLRIHKQGLMQQLFPAPEAG